MALFGANAKEQPEQAQSAGAAGAQSKPEEEVRTEMNAEEQAYYAAMTGEGTDFNSSQLTVPYLSMVQTAGTLATAGHEPGTWVISSTGENLGPVVEVICVACKSVWVERDSVGKTFKTVGRYPVGGIGPNGETLVRVNKVMPKPGMRGFPTMTNADSGNKVEELMVYAVMLKEKPELGYMCFSPTAISMSACKAWNTKMQNARITVPGPQGKMISVPARLFAYSWHLALTSVPKPGMSGAVAENIANRNVKLGLVERGELVDKSMFMSYVQPQLEDSQSSLLMIAAPEPDDSGDAVNVTP